MTTANSLNPFTVSIVQKPAVPVLEDQFVNMKFITALTTMSDKWFYKLIQEGKFPEAIKMGRKSVWLKSEVEHWLMQRVMASRGGVKA